jgi:hypothetical protein
MMKLLTETLKPAVPYGLRFVSLTNELAGSGQDSGKAQKKSRAFVVRHVMPGKILTTRNHGTSV